jgi:hypothetical protein
MNQRHRDHIVQRTRCILVHGGSFSLAWLRLATSSQPNSGPPALRICAKTFYVIHHHPRSRCAAELTLHGRPFKKEGIETAMVVSLVYGELEQPFLIFGEQE